MGSASTKEARSGDAGHRGHHSGISPGLEPGAGPSTRSDRTSSRGNRVSRADLGGILGLGPTRGSSSQLEPPYERRETKQEREARRLEKERIARIAERERSMKEEHVDGGFLVTMGVYTGPEDFNKQIVRQLQIERKLAPFWRGLNDFSDEWTEPQIIAAARGLPIPAADQTPPDELIPRPLSPSSQGESTPNLEYLTVPIRNRSQSTASDHAASTPASALPSPLQNQQSRSSSPFKPRGKALASVFSGSPRNGSTAEFVPTEIKLPHDPFVNGQPIEVFLYKNAIDCPICFLSYPPYLNHTRCCDQPICSECFVQIKRPDPHFPEGHNENDPNRNPEESAGLLVSEPACCPYCTQPDFGVTYEPPPFRRGLAYSISPAALGTMSTAMSSSSSINSASLSPAVGSPGSGRRRNESLSAGSPNVILTDRIRPEWAAKLQAARAHLARRAAAATALHTAAFLMGNAENRAFRSRFGRRNTGGSGSAGASPGGGNGDNGDSGSGTPLQGGLDPRGSSGRGGGEGRRGGLEELEDMMFMEAIRLSLAAEEERKRKAEKEAKKEAKRREKEEKKAAKAAAKRAGPYEGAGSHSGHSSASASSLSLSGLGFGRRRGNSAASNLRIEATSAAALAAGGSSNLEPSSRDKGKGVDRPVSLSAESSQASTAEPASPGSRATHSSPRQIPSPHLPAGPSHLRQMSSASSVSSSVLDSHQGSFTAPSYLQDPRGSGLSLGSRSGPSEDGGDQDPDRDPSASTEPMFNFRSLAEVVGVSLEGENAGRRLSAIEAERKGKEAEGSQSHQGPSRGDSSVAPESPLEVSTSQASMEPEHTKEDLSSQAERDMASTNPNALSPPTVTVTPETPKAGDTEELKQLGYASAVEHADQAVQ